MTSSVALARHAIDRLGFGPRPGDLDRIAAQGVDRWIEQQLAPASIPLPAALSDRIAALTTLSLSSPQLFVEYGPPSMRPPGGGKPTPQARKAANQRGRVIVSEAIEGRLVRAIDSPRQLEESLVAFWFNHFNVFAGKGLDRLWVGAFEQQAIRPHVLGRFRDMLGATAKHPAMLFYLDNWMNTAPGSPGARGPFEGINENYARELMELHTLGVSGGYTQADVIALAHILTGWTIGPVPRQRPIFAAMGGPFRRAAMARERLQGRGSFAFDPDRHDFSDKQFLGRTIRGGGMAEGEAALDMLARSPATAHRLGFKLAQYFLADDPDAATVAHMAETYLASDGNIRAVLAALFASAAFRSPANFGAKFKTPYRYVISAVRAAGIEVSNFRPLRGMLFQLGEPPYGHIMPQGYDDTEAAWLNPDAMMRRLSFAVALAHGNLPLTAAPDGASPRREPASPLDAAALMRTLGGAFSPATRDAIAAAAPALRAGIVLGSPEFMRC